MGLLARCFAGANALDYLFDGSSGAATTLTEQRIVSAKV